MKGLKKIGDEPVGQKGNTIMVTEAYVKSFQMNDSGVVQSLRLSPASGYSFSSKTDKGEKSYLLFVEKNCAECENMASANAKLVRLRA